MTLLLATLLISTQGATPPAPAAPAPASAPSALAAPPPPAPPPAPAAPKPRFRTPVLAQGAIISSAPGFAAASASEPGLVAFTLEESMAGRVRRTLTLLPSDPADDVKAMLANPGPETPWRFEVSGHVYDYYGRAFLLPIAIIALRNPPAPPFLARTEPAGFTPPPPPAPRHAPFLDAYAAEAQPEVTPARVATSATMPHERDLAAIAATDDEFAAELERRLARGVRNTSAAKLPEAEIDRAMVLAAGVRLQDRRAAITRDPVTGAWRAVLEAAPTPGGPLAMELLPCRALERVERSVKSAAIGTPWLVSGEVVASGDRNYLILSHARELPRDRWVFR